MRKNDENLTLKKLQNYIKEGAKELGFDKLSAEERCLMLDLTNSPQKKGA